MDKLGNYLFYFGESFEETCFIIEFISVDQRQFRSPLPALLTDLFLADFFEKPWGCLWSCLLLVDSVDHRDWETQEVIFSHLLVICDFRDIYWQTIRSVAFLSTLIGLQFARFPPLVWLRQLCPTRGPHLAQFSFCGSKSILYTENLSLFWKFWIWHFQCWRSSALPYHDCYHCN